MKVTLIVLSSLLGIWAHPSLFAAPNCHVADCKIEENCRCSSTKNPISDVDDPAPQLIAITVSESIVQTLYDNYLKDLFFDRTNPDGGPIGLTFYVPHEYTDYTLVQDLWLRGYEIGDHSITKNSSQEYWRSATAKDLDEEFSGQKIIISTFANIPEADIVGVRTPQLQLEGDLTFNAYEKAGFLYDNSWPTMSTDLLLPYTLDYASTQKCLVTITCPINSHEHFWVAPITNIRGNNTECNSLAACYEQGSAEDIAQWLLEQIATVRSHNRAPLTFRLDSYWFLQTANSLEGFTLFLDELRKFDDIFLVSVQDVIEWVKNPVPASNYTSPIRDRSPDCAPISCALKNVQGSERYMKSCVSCPEVYPWKGNPLGKAQK